MATAAASGAGADPLGDLPLEVFDLIFAHLDAPSVVPPRLHRQPFSGLTDAADAPLKHAACASRAVRARLLPRLFRHARLRLGCDGPAAAPAARTAAVQAFERFLRAHGPARVRVESLTLEFRGTPAGHADACADEAAGETWERWAGLVGALGPARLTVLAPPRVLGALTGWPVRADHSSSFHMPYHLLSLAQSDAPSTPPPEAAAIAPTTPPPDILGIAPWSAALLNEGSFQRAWGEYHQGPPLRPPSILPGLARAVQRRHHHAAAGAPEAGPRHLAYVAIYPFEAHLRPLLDLCAAPLRSLTLQLEPGPEGVARDRWQGSWFDGARASDDAGFAHLVNLLWRIVRPPLPFLSHLRVAVALETNEASARRRQHAGLAAPARGARRRPRPRDVPAELPRDRHRRRVRRLLLAGALGRRPGARLRHRAVASARAGWAARATDAGLKAGLEGFPSGSETTESSACETLFSLRMPARVGL